MKKRVFREYMREELIQKTILFSDVFGLSIDKWKPAKESDNFPYRIYLYEKNNIVGYLDIEADICDIWDDKYIYIRNYPIELYTPVGNIIGFYDQKYFKFNFETINSDTVTEINGFFSVEKELTNDYYQIGAYLSFKNNAEDFYNVTFNHCIGNGTLNISKNHGLDDLQFYVNSGLSISHQTDVVAGNPQNMNDIRIEEDNSLSVLGTFKFNGLPSYQKDVTIENPVECSNRLDVLIDLEKVNKEIMNHDSHIFELIEEVRNLLQFPTNKGTISTYDKLTFHCFHNDKDRIKHSFIKDENISKRLMKNPVLQKMCTNHKKFY